MPGSALPHAPSPAAGATCFSGYLQPAYQKRQVEAALTRPWGARGSFRSRVKLRMDTSSAPADAAAPPESLAAARPRRVASGGPEAAAPAAAPVPAPTASGRAQSGPKAPVKRAAAKASDAAAPMSTALALVEEQDAAAAPEGAAPEAARKKRGKDKRSATKGPPEVATPDGAAPAPPKADARKKAASGGKGRPADAPPAATPTKPLPVGAVGKAARQEMTELLVAAGLEWMRPALKEGGLLGVIELLAYADGGLALPGTLGLAVYREART